MSRKLNYTIAAVASFLVLIWAGNALGLGRDPGLIHKISSVELPLIGHKTLTKEEIAKVLGKRPLPGGMLETSEVVHIGSKELLVQYSVEAELQKTVAAQIKSGRVKYGAFVALNPKTGQVLAMVSHGMDDNMTLRATFPSASVFKIVTAAAVLDGKRLQHNSLIPVKGSYHTLYKQNVLHAGGIDPQGARRFRLISLGDAFGKSVNSVFGKLGIFGAGSFSLRKYAKLFLFNTSVPFEMGLEESTAVIPDEDFALAESASGYTRLNNMSPLHGALIASAVVNDGVIMEPTVVSHIFDRDGKYEYTPSSHVLASAIAPETARQLRLMMEQTIINGTSRRSFAGFSKNIVLSQLNMGGKTGTLEGSNPVGRYDWFVGFAQKGDKKIAVASLCIHSGRRGVKAASIARKAFEIYFKPDLAKADR